MRKRIHPERKKSLPQPKKKEPIVARPVDPESKFSVPFGRVPTSYTYGDSFPTCWLHHQQKQVF